MHTVQIISLLSTLFYVILIIAGFIVKRSLNKTLEKSESLNSDQIQNMTVVVNVVYYAFAIFLLGVILLPYIIRFTL